MNGEKCCWTCEYHQVGEEYWECDNDKSPKFQCPVAGGDVCEDYVESNWHYEERLYGGTKKCDTCRWHNRECDTAEPYEEKSGLIVGDDFCELYVKEESK